MYYTHPGCRTSIFGENRAYCIRDFTVWFMWLLLNYYYYYYWAVTRFLACLQWTGWALNSPAVTLLQLQTYCMILKRVVFSTYNEMRVHAVWVHYVCSVMLEWQLTSVAACLSEVTITCCMFVKFFLYLMYFFTDITVLWIRISADNLTVHASLLMAEDDWEWNTWITCLSAGFKAKISLAALMHTSAVAVKLCPNNCLSVFHFWSSQDQRC